MKTWIDFLVEEDRVRLDYEFTTPYVYPTDLDDKVETVQLDDLKTKFKLENGEQSDELWKEYIISQVQEMKPYFRKEANKRDLEFSDDMWESFKEEVVY